MLGLKLNLENTGLSEKNILKYKITCNLAAQMR